MPRVRVPFRKLCMQPLWLMAFVCGWMAAAASPPHNGIPERITTPALVKALAPARSVLHSLYPSTSSKAPSSRVLYAPPAGPKVTPLAMANYARMQELQSGGGFLGLFGGGKGKGSGRACKAGSRRAERVHRRSARKVAKVCQPVTRVKHTPLKRYKVLCNPGLKRTTGLERFGERVESALTNHRRNCEIVDLFSDISKGEMIDTDKYGKALVVGFKVRKRVFQYYEYPHPYATKGKLRKRKFRAIRNITLKVTEEDPNFPNGKDGYYLVCLNREETKEIIIRGLIMKGKIDRVALVYPEERENIGVWKEKYGETTVAQLIQLGPIGIVQ